MILRLILFSIFVIPLAGIIPYPGRVVWDQQYFALYSMFCIGICFRAWKLNPWLCLFGIYSVFSYNFVTENGMRAFIINTQLILSILAITEISKINEQQCYKVVKAVCWLSLIQGTYMIIQCLNLDPIFNLVGDLSKDSPVGLSGSRNQIGLFMAATIPYLLHSFYWILPICIFALFASKTTSAFVGGVAGVLCYVFLFKKVNIKTLTVVFAIIAVLGGVFFTKFEGLSNNAFMERVRLYQLTLKQANEGRAYMEKFDRQQGITVTKYVTTKPLFGFGIGNFMRISPFTQKPILYNTLQNIPYSHVYAHAHNDFLEVLFDFGFIGASIILGAIGHLLYTFAKNIRSWVVRLSFCAIVAHAVTSLGIFTVHTALSGMLLIIALGLFYSGVNHGKNASVV